VRDNVKLRCEPYKVDAVFAPLEAIIKQLETDGTINVSISGCPMFIDHESGEWFDAISGLNGLIDAFEIHERRSGCDLNLAPLKMLSSRLEYGMPLFVNDIQQIKQTITRMREATMEMTAGYARDLIRDFQIKDEIEQRFI
jgi:hypothetical protein